MNNMQETEDGYTAHRCGRCNNSTGVTNPDCPNRPRLTTIAAPMSQADIDWEFNRIAGTL